MKRTIEALSFDLWDTLVIDDSDEPKRRARGLRSKRDERRWLVWQALGGEGEAPSLASVTLAYDAIDAAAGITEPSSPTRASSR